MVVPDPSGQLKEGQVFFKPSRNPDGPLQEQVVVRMPEILWRFLLISSYTRLDGAHQIPIAILVG
jgi:hypothetical protein